MISIRNVLVLGAGKVGGTVADMLADYHRMPVTLADRDPPRRALDDPLVRRTVLDVEDDAALAAALAGHQLLINALPFQQAGRVAAAARTLGVHYLDLTEDVAATRAIRGLADGAAVELAALRSRSQLVGTSSPA